MLPDIGLQLFLELTGLHQAYQEKTSEPFASYINCLSPNQNLNYFGHSIILRITKFL